MIHEHVIPRTPVAKAEKAQPIVVGHWALLSLFLLWLTLLASAFTLGMRLG